MLTNTVTPARPVVKLADDVLAGVGKNDGLFIQHRCTVVAALDLDEAIKVAQMVLRYAERNGIAIPEATADIEQLPPDLFDEEYEGYRPNSAYYGAI